MDALTIHVSVEEDCCIGNGNCVRVAPDVFDQRDEDGVVRLIDPVPPMQRLAAVRDAEQGCPGQAIHVVANGHGA